MFRELSIVDALPKLIVLRRYVKQYRQFVRISPTYNSFPHSIDLTN